MGLVVSKGVYSQHLFVFKSRGLLSAILGEEAFTSREEKMAEKAPQHRECLTGNSIPTALPSPV